MNCLAYFNSMKRFSLLPYGSLWRNCFRSSRNSKKICSTLHLYKPIAQLLEKKCSSARERGYSEYVTHIILWFYLCNHGEDLNKWGWKIHLGPTGLHESQGKMIRREGPSRKMVAPVSSEQSSRQRK